MGGDDGAIGPPKRLEMDFHVDSVPAPHHIPLAALGSRSGHETWHEEVPSHCGRLCYHFGPL